MKLTLHIWRQSGPHAKGRIEDFTLDNVSPDSSFLEMMDQLNEELQSKGKEPVAFDSDCREGICGSCSMVINGRPHGPWAGTTTCQLHMRAFKDGDEIWVEPFRAKAFPVVKDLVVDRSSFDRIVQAGGYITVRTGSAPEANLTPIPKADADTAFDAAACIGCGACVAVCKNASATLFLSAKVSHLVHVPQGEPERMKRVKSMVAQMDEEGFGACTNTGDCTKVCPKEIGQNHINTLNREYLRAVTWDNAKAPTSSGSAG
jgi:succinate dehydrogenase / fumarate reductase iron-sulfur subunit